MSAKRGSRPTWHTRGLWLGSPEASRLVLVAAAAVVMALSLVLTASRSGIASLAVALVVTGALVARRQDTSRRSIGRVSATAIIVVVVVCVGGWAGRAVVGRRFSQGGWSELNDRRGAWKDAIRVASAFPGTGTGLNTYGVAMLFYQRHEPSKFYSEAHNDYLQLAAEGGLMLTIPAVLCVGSLVVAVRRRFIDDTGTRAYWLRAGAATGLAAIALQETVDFSLQIPGNALLFAVLCAIALHRAQ